MSKFKPPHSCIAKHQTERTTATATKDYERIIENVMSRTNALTDSGSATRSYRLNADSNERALKWKEFSLVIAESYDKIKAELQAMVSENNKLKNSNAEISQYNGKLKIVLKECEAHNKHIICALEKETKARKTAEASLEACNSEINQLKAKLNSELKAKVALYKAIEKLKKETEIVIQQPMENKNAEMAESLEFYKKLAGDHMKECKSLAEQLICLRSDMDHSTTQRIKHMNSSEISLKSSQKVDKRIYQSCTSLQSSISRAIACQHATPSRNAMVEVNNKGTDTKSACELVCNTLLEKTSPNFPYITSYNSSSHKDENAV